MGKPTLERGGAENNKPEEMKRNWSYFNVKKCFEVQPTAVKSKSPREKTPSSKEEWKADLPFRFNNPPLPHLPPRVIKESANQQQQQQKPVVDEVPQIPPKAKRGSTTPEELYPLQKKNKGGGKKKKDKAFMDDVNVFSGGGSFNNGLYVHLNKAPKWETSNSLVCHRKGINNNTGHHVMARQFTTGDINYHKAEPIPIKRDNKIKVHTLNHSLPSLNRLPLQQKKQKPPEHQQQAPLGQYKQQQQQHQQKQQFQLQQQKETQHQFKLQQILPPLKTPPSHTSTTLQQRTISPQMIIRGQKPPLQPLPQLKQHLLQHQHQHQRRTPLQQQQQQQQQQQIKKRQAGWVGPYSPQQRIHWPASTSPRPTHIFSGGTGGGSRPPVPPRLKSNQ